MFLPLPCVWSGGGASYISSAPSQGTRPRFASGTLRAHPEGVSLPPNLFNSSPVRPNALRAVPTSDILERD